MRCIGPPPLSDSPARKVLYKLFPMDVNSDHSSHSTASNMTPSAAIAILFVLLATYVQANTKELSPSEVIKKKVHDHCIKETNSTPEQAKILYQYKDVPKDDVEKCFMECVYKMTGGVDAEGKYSIEGFNKLIDLKYKGDENTQSKKIVADCAGKAAPKEGEKCSLGRAIRECLAAATKEYAFFSI